MKFLKQIFQDISGAYSMKRTGFAINLALLGGTAGAPFVHHFDPLVLEYGKSAMVTLGSSLSVIAGMIASEQLIKFAPKKDGSA